MGRVGGGGVGKAWQRPTLPCLRGTVPWALRAFTAEFGMGSGGAPAPSHQALPTPFDVGGMPRSSGVVFDRGSRRIGPRGRGRGAGRSAGSWGSGLGFRGNRGWGEGSPIERLGPVG